MARIKYANTIESVREGVKTNLSGINENGRYAVIVSTEYAKNKIDYGVQFWTPLQIAGKIVSTADGVKSVFVEFFCAETGDKFLKNCYQSIGRMNRTTHHFK